MNESHKKLLRSKKLSVTPVRLAVLKTLDMHPHVDADRIFSIVSRDIATTSKQAIYNNLHTLAEHGIVREIKPKGQSALYEPNKNDNHHHLVCRNCNAVMDTDCHDVAPCLTPKNNHGFIIDEAEVVFWGLCPACQS